mmetsp:Transcript_60545/g.184967  ORF Transcript_60545/g.184967 Transcript_60545/m.184967 type:complete len:207 (+) Transcript_60545:2237-2857(+)
MNLRSASPNSSTAPARKRGATRGAARGPPMSCSRFPRSAGRSRKPAASPAHSPLRTRRGRLFSNRAPPFPICPGGRPTSRCARRVSTCPAACRCAPWTAPPRAARRSPSSCCGQRLGRPRAARAVRARPSATARARLAASRGPQRPCGRTRAAARPPGRPPSPGGGRGRPGAPSCPCPRPPGAPGAAPRGSAAAARPPPAGSSGPG